MKRLIATALLLTLTACGGGGDSTSTTAEQALAISITGLPAGTDADVLVTGPGGFTRNLATSQTLTGLAAGVYAVTAGSALNGTDVFTARVASQSVPIARGARPTVVIDYQSTGTLRLALKPVATLSAPLFLTAPAGDPRLFVVERAGRVRVIKNDVLLATPVLDISARVSTVGEGGLLSLAFDPQFATNGFLYVHFTDPTGDVAVERFHISAGDPNIADPASALRVITIEHRTFSNHKGGRLAFGPDGFLYLSVGDGGGGGDPLGSGQNLNTLLAKLIRIDVSNATNAQPYAIPPSNPFVGQANRRPEIWAYGLRNPWRFAFDPPTGLLYIADVGQDIREEVDVVPVAAPGFDYGWNIMEGSRCFAATPCSAEGLTLPVLEYEHPDGCSIAGGFVYRGNAIPELRGRYLYSDFCGGWLRSFHYAGGQAAERIDWNITPVAQTYSFGEDGSGELYFLATNDVVYKIVRQ